MFKVKSVWLIVFLLCLTASFLPFQTLPVGPKATQGTVAVVDYQSEAVDYTSTSRASGNDHYGKQWAIPKIMVPQAWEVTSGEASIVIAVLDTGIDEGHEDLAGKVIAKVNFTDSSTTDDVYGHGTHVAGIIAAAADNSVGIAGVAYNCRLMNVKVADDQGAFDNSAAAKGVNWAVDHGASVINMSLVSTEPSRELEKAINYAWSKGTVVIAAAGNFVGTKVAYPAYYSDCIAVAATDTNDCVASWSSKGDWVDVAAPGVDIYSTLPGNRYDNRSGTSMATAHVSGLAGLLFALRSDKNNNGFVNDEVRVAIESGCDELGISPIRWRINAFNAVNRALTSR
ncbi:MAG: peptidase S8 [Chloroflexota bacterium]|nr:MAG: peptidase S8 [Chloroflexota bacterium]